MDPRDVWKLGDYDAVAERLMPAAEALVEAAGIVPGGRVLDVAAGTGNVAVAAARAGARVTASDFAPTMVARGAARTDGLEVEWVEADAQDLPFEDDGFDCVVSAFGVIFAPEPERAVAELLRVTKPGGRIALATWHDAGIQGATNAVVAAFTGHDPAATDRWGDPGKLGELLQAAADVDVQERCLRWMFADAGGWADFMGEAAPPAVAMRGQIGEARWGELRAKVTEAVREHGTATGDGFVVEPPYLIATATRPGG